MARSQRADPVGGIDGALRRCAALAPKRPSPSSTATPLLNGFARRMDDNVRLLFSAPDFAWPPVRGGHIRVLSQLRVLTSLPEVERVRVFWLREDPLAWRECEGLERAIPKVGVARPVFHPVHLRRHPRYIPRIAWLRLAHGIPYVAGKWESPTVRRALAAELRGGHFDAVWLGALGTARYLPLIRRLAPRARVILDGHNVESDIWREFARRQRGIKRAVVEAEWQGTH